MQVLHQLAEPQPVIMRGRLVGAVKTLRRSRKLLGRCGVNIDPELHGEASHGRSISSMNPDSREVFCYLDQIDVKHALARLTRG